MQTSEPGRLAGRREWIGLTLLVLPTLLVAMDMTALFLALPHLTADLHASGTEQLWISDSYGFLVAGLVITMGTLGDRIGRRRLLLIGGLAFAVLSAVAAYSTTPQMLILARALLGIAGATLMPSTLALISNTFRDAGQRGKAIAVWATCQFAGGALGPVLAGFLLQRFWWGSVFLIAVPVMAVLLILGPFVLPEYRAPQAGRIDILSVVLSLAAVLPIVYGLKQLTLEGSHSLVIPVASMIVGAAVALVFVRRQLTLESPLLNLRLFRNGSFTTVMVALVFAGVVMAGTGLLVTQYLQSVLGYSPLESAMLFAPMGLGVAVGTMTAPVLARRVKQTTAIASGLAVSAVGCLVLTQVSSGGGLVLAIVGVTVLALGTGPLFALGTGLVIGSVPPERAGSAASMSETGNYFGGSLGLALIGVVSAAVYHAHMAHSVPNGAPAGAGETLAGAVAASQQLAPGQAESLLTAAKDAFTAGLNLTGVLGATVFAGLAFLVYRVWGRAHADQRSHELASPQVEAGVDGFDAQAVSAG